MEKLNTELRDMEAKHLNPHGHVVFPTYHPNMIVIDYGLSEVVGLFREIILWK